MRPRRTALCLVLFSVLLAGVCSAATGYGHYILAREMLRSSAASFPPELQAVIADPDCRNSFCGGAVAPDIAEDFGHYGKTAEAVQGMLAGAREHLAAAQKSGDATALRTAQRELAFSYGWLSHYGTDLNVHPEVNAFPVVGDAFKYLDTPRKIAHGAVEVQLDDYLMRTFGKPEPGWKQELSIPWSFLSAQSRVDEAELRKSSWWTNLQGEAGVAWTQNVTIDTTPQWEGVVKASLRDSLTFIREPARFENWDLCAGRISTEAFDGLRAYELTQNGGKLPDGWGRNYRDLYAARRAEWAKVEEESRRVNHGLPPLPVLKLDTFVQQVNDWLAVCLDRLEKDKATDPARVANREQCLAYAKQIQDGGNKLYCRGCKIVTAQYWCPNDPDLGDHWMCGCSGVTQLSRLLRPDGRTYNDYASERIAVYDKMMQELRELATRLKTEGYTNPGIRQEINRVVAAANGQAPATAAEAGPGQQPGAGGAAGTPPAASGPSGGGTGGSGGKPGAAAGAAGAERTGAAAGPMGPPLTPGSTVVRNARYGYSLQLPPKWRETATPAGVTQRFALNGSPANALEVTRLPAGGVAIGRLRQAALTIMDNNPALARKLQERTLEVPNGNGLDVVYAGAANGREVLTVTRFIAVADATYIIAGTVPADAGEAERMAVSGMIESFHW